MVIEMTAMACEDGVFIGVRYIAIVYRDGGIFLSLTR